MSTVSPVYHTVETVRFIQLWWLGGRASASHSVESLSLILWWIEFCLGTYDGEILNKKARVLMLVKSGWMVDIIHVISNKP